MQNKNVVVPGVVPLSDAFGRSQNIIVDNVSINIVKK